MKHRSPALRSRVRPWGLAAVVALGLLRPGGALRAQDATLDRVESLSSDGRTTSARDTLAAWWKAGFQGASTETRQRALWLRGNLSVDPTAARKDYLQLVLEHPGGPYSARALLRVAQERAAEGRAADAARRLEELLREYPNSPQRLDAGRWLDAHRDAVSRAPFGPVAGGGPIPSQASADTAAGASAAPASPSDSAAAAAPAAEPVSPADTAGARSGAVVAPSDSAGAAGSGPAAGSASAGASAALPVSIQLGAFSTMARARTLLQAARNEGIAGLRIVRIEGSDLIRVRAGRFADSASATDLRNRILARGFEATIVEDGSRERPIQ